jgi:hypothetical protein
MTQMGDKANAFALRIAKKAQGRGMPDVCVLQQASEPAIDALGFGSSTYPDTGAQMPCRIDGREVTREFVIEGKVVSLRVYRLVVVAVRPDGSAVTIREKDKLRVLARGPIAERIIDIQHVGEREGVMLEVFGLIVQGG